MTHSFAVCVALYQPAAHANPQLNLMDHLHDAAFLDTAMGMPVMGTAESVSGLSAESLQAFSEATLAGSRVVVAGAGAVHQVPPVSPAGDDLV